VPPLWVQFLPRLGLKTGIEFTHIVLESGMVFEGTAGVCKRICCFNSKQERKKRLICEFEMDFKKSFFCWRSNLSN